MTLTFKIDESTKIVTNLEIRFDDDNDNMNGLEGKQAVYDYLKKQFEYEKINYEDR